MDKCNINERLLCNFLFVSLCQTKEGKILTLLRSFKTLLPKKERGSPEMRNVDSANFLWRVREDCVLADQFGVKSSSMNYR